MSEETITRAQQILLDEAPNLYMIGRLRKDYAPIQKTPSGNIKFFIHPLCDEPKPLADIDIFNAQETNYIGFDNAQTNYSLPAYYDKYSYDEDQKFDDITEHLTGKLIIFNPKYTYNNKDNRWFKNLDLRQRVDDNIGGYIHFNVIPKIQIDPTKFEQVLKKKEFFDLKGFFGNQNETPEIILCGSYAYRLKDVTLLEPMVVYNESDSERWRGEDIDSVVKIDITKLEKYKENLISATDTIFFMEDTLRNQILTATNYELICEEKKTVISVKDKGNDENEQEESVEIIESREVLFLNGLQTLTVEKGLQYKYEDLVNFHTSVKTNSLTILAGMSGTGKTQLAYNYARMLNLSEDNNTLLFMPISPAYTEPSDVLGYLNSMNGLYVPAETGLVKFLQHAYDNAEQMHMVIFDEMNLSQIEYWFSPFISILEKDSDDSYLNIYDDDAHCINKKVFPPKIKLGENIIFIGTVNIDETTKDFSNRLLDRTFIVSLEKISFEKFYREFDKNNKGDTDITKSKCESVSEYMNWNKSNRRTYMNAFEDNLNELVFLDELDALIKRYIPDGGISYRVLRNIANYINNIPKNNDMMIIDRKKAFDTIINQTIMTKIRGTQTQLQQFLGDTSNKDESIIESELIDLLTQYMEISDFEIVKKNIFKKAEDLRINGYTN